MSTLYFRLPSKAAFDSTEQWETLACPYALASASGMLEQEGVSSLSQASALVARAQRVVLLVAASDVTMLRVQLPPMSAARQRAALPNLVEDQLISDPAECIVIGGALADGLRTVAVVQRAWLEMLVRTVLGSGMARIAALPAQMCVPHEPDRVAAVIIEQDADTEVTLRLGPQEGMGLAILPEHPASAAREAVDTVLAMAGGRPVALRAPQGRVADFEQAVADLGALEQVTVQADSWQQWISGAAGSGIDLALGLGASARPKLNWKPWRLSLVLATLLLLVNVVPLNIEWVRLKREYDGLRASMLQIYKAAFPNETVIVDPLAQARQKVAAGRRNAGQGAPDDFGALAAAFGEAWLAAAPRGPNGLQPTLAGLEYKERSLLVRLKPEAQAPFDAISAALARRNLSLSAAPEQPGVVVWQVRTGK
ncbi:MAG: type II secretion system protein GspL [Noviherbaspirillum sp.]